MLLFSFHHLSLLYFLIYFHFSQDANPDLGDSAITEVKLFGLSVLVLVFYSSCTRKRFVFVDIRGWSFRHGRCTRYNSFRRSVTWKTRSTASLNLFFSSGGNAASSMAFTLEMDRICIRFVCVCICVVISDVFSRHSSLQIPNLDFRGPAAGIDARLVLVFIL